ncbi:MAG: sodium/solute symporter [Myxococcota bacterium]|nr:sodium/solute symporter [Myxococcota bacterium]
MTNALTLHPIDASIIVIYFTAVLAIGLWIGRNTKGGEDLFLAGRSLGWIAIGFSLFASNISSTTLIGLVGSAYDGGLYISNYEWMATVVLVFFVLFFVPIFLRSRISTIPEFLERRFGAGSRTYFSGLTIVTNILVDTAGSLYAGAVVLQLFFPELDMWTTCIALALIAGVYTAAGGLAAVVYTDVIQAVVLLLGSCLMTYFVFAHPAIDFSWAALTDGIGDPAKFSVVSPEHRPLNDPKLPWLGTLIGVPILGFYFWVTNQFIVQRVLGARSVDDARWGALLGGLLKLPVLFIMVLPGLAFSIIWAQDNPGVMLEADKVFPHMVTSLLPVGVIGLVLAGLIAAIMSSIDSTLNSASALITLDFIKPRRPNLTEAETLKLGRISMAIIMVVSALWAPQIAQFDGLFKYIQEMLAYMVPPVTVLFLLGVFWKGGTAQGALATLIGGHAVAVGLFMGEKGLLTGGERWWDAPIHFTLVAGIVFGASLIIYVATAAWGDAKSDDEIAELMVQPAPPAQPGLKDYRIQSALLLALTAAVVAMFW